MEKETGGRKTDITSTQSKYQKTLNFEILQEFRLKNNRFVLRSSFRIEWCKNFQEHVTDLKITVENEHYSFFYEWLLY